MTMPSAPTVTQLLLDWSAGDQAALQKLIPLVEQELRRLAKYYLRKENAGHTLQTNALVNEAYLRLIDVKQVSLQNRAQFFAFSSRIMRNILVDFARSRPHLPGGREGRKVSIEEAMTVSRERSLDLVALDDALHDLATFDERKSQIVELRFFGGLSVEETAQALNTSPRTVIREWNAAKAWLYRELNGGASDEE
jgi:RNA polymerase sigma factor (TIGR02999 family)